MPGRKFLPGPILLNGRLGGSQSEITILEQTKPTQVVGVPCCLPFDDASQSPHFESVAQSGKRYGNTAPVGMYETPVAASLPNLTESICV